MARRRTALRVSEIDDGAIRYGNIEGVAWITRTGVVTVSDRRKKKHQPKGLSDKDQSIHIFDIPQ